MLDGDGDAILPTRRGFIQGATTAAALAGLPSVSTRALAASSRAKTLVVAAPATPLSLDVENSLSLGTIDTVGAFYDYLIAFDMVPDPKVPGAMRENLAPTRPRPEVTISRANSPNPANLRPTARRPASSCGKASSATTAIH